MRPDARERRTIVIAAWVAAAALATAYVGIPFARRVTARNAQIAVERERVGRLTTYVRRQSEIDSAIATRDAALAQSPARVLHGRSAALVASELQRVLQDYARMSRVSVSRIDVPGTPDSSGTSLSMGATISAVGDIYGLVQLLGYLQHGPQLVTVRDLSVQSTSALRGDLLQLSVQVRAPFLVDEP